MMMFSRLALTGLSVLLFVMTKVCNVSSMSMNGGADLKEAASANSGIESLSSSSHNPAEVRSQLLEEILADSDDGLELEDKLRQELYWLSMHHPSSSAVASLHQQMRLSKKSSDDQQQQHQLLVLQQASDSEIEFCSSCIRSGVKTDLCSLCFQKYFYKASSKRVKPSSKYWYSRAG